MALRTNPAYAHLAYRRAIVVKLLDYLREEYLTLSSAEPRNELICDEVFSADAVVPAAEITLVAEELEQESEHLRLELGKFTFGKVQEEHGLFNRPAPTPASAAAAAVEVNEEGAINGPSGKLGKRRSRRR
jgi:hypothetical protein